MQMNRIPYTLLLLLVASCTHRRDDIVCETYVHRYGVELPPEEWEARGRHGQVFSTLKDGVTVAQTYDSGILHGETTYTYPHRDTIQKREFYDQGALTQEILTYSNGLPYKQVTHHSPKSQTSVIWYDSGVPQCEENYENGLLVYGKYFNLNHAQEAIVEDHNGTRICRSRDGGLESTDEIQNGHMVQRTTYHPNKTPASIIPYVNGAAEGQKRTFQLGGEPNTIEEWKNGYQHGNTILFEDGERCAVIPYVQGCKHGKESRYRDGETVVEEISWVYDRRHGPSYSYIGNVKNTDWYFQDKHVNKQTFEALSNQ